MDSGDSVRMLRVAALVVPVGAAALGGLAYLPKLLAAQKAPPLAAPKTYTTFAAADQSFKCDAPQGWKQSGGQSHGIASSASFTPPGQHSGTAKIEIASDLQGSLMGDMIVASDRQGSNFGGGEGMPADASATGLPPGIPGIPAGGGGPKRPPAVEVLHKREGKSFTKGLQNRGYSDVREKPMQTFQSAAGEARYSEFTAKGDMFKTDIHGYRATILGGERCITFTGRCRESDWPALKASFGRVLGSIKAGNG